MTFAKPPKAAASAGPLANPLSLVKYVLLGIGTLLFLFFAVRHIRKGERRSLGGEPVWLREIEAPRPLAEVARQSAQAETEVFELSAEGSKTRRQLASLVERDPERVAAQVRNWMQED
jgi:flagellar M-ring protein FliF